ncbi:hypothetical protein ACFQHO_39820 [Actinomadura yumaensis]|uniref:Y-family DNA polymerase n=1 Tax=Actinomadura yumaensis TaxID=111807 RepID=UPI00360BA8B0
MTRVLAVWCPDWPATAAGVDAATPGAVVLQNRVVACTAAARAEGVRRGQRLRDAQRRCPGLAVRERDTDAEGRLFERVVEAVAELVPKVEVVRPGLCAIPVRGAARFYGGEEALRVLVQDAVVEAGFDCGSGIADGLFAAELAARGGPGTLGGEGGWSFRRARRRRSWRPTRWRCSTGPSWPICSDASGSARSARSPRCRPGTSPGASARTARSRTGSRAARSRARSRLPARPPTCRCARTSTRPPRRPSRWCSPPSGWPASCTRDSRRAG